MSEEDYKIAYENVMIANKMLEQENKQLKELIDKYEEEHKTTFETWLKEINILTELEKWLKEPEYFNGRKLRQDYITIMTIDVLEKIQELKEKYK